MMMVNNARDIVAVYEPPREGEKAYSVLAGVCGGRGCSACREFALRVYAWCE